MSFVGLILDTPVCTRHHRCFSSMDWAHLHYYSYNSCKTSAKLTHLPLLPQGTTNGAIEYLDLYVFILPLFDNRPVFLANVTAFSNQDSTNDLPYNFGPSNSWNANSTYLSPYEWLYGAYAPPFWAENFEALALSEVRFV